MRIINLDIPSAHDINYGNEEDELYAYLVSKIASHPVVNKFVREAIELDLAKHKVA